MAELSEKESVISMLALMSMNEDVKIEAVKRKRSCGYEEKAMLMAESQRRKKALDFAIKYLQVNEG